MVDVVIENGELHGKGRAELRNEQLKGLIGKWEAHRDALCDEIASRQGKLELLEELIKQAYAAILKVNQEEQTKEQTLIDGRMEELKKEEEDQEEKRRQAEALERHQKKEAAVKTGKRKGKGRTPPTEKAAELRRRKKE